MTLWMLREEERLAKWREFRLGLDMLPFEDAIKETVHLWSYAPFVTHFLDRVPVTDWPDPWSMLIDNTYCDQAKAYGMLATLFLSAHGQSHKFSLVNGQGSTSLEEYSLVWIDEGKYVLNYIHDEVISNEQIENFTLLSCYTIEDLHLDNY